MSPKTLALSSFFRELDDELGDLIGHAVLPLILWDPGGWLVPHVQELQCRFPRRPRAVRRHPRREHLRLRTVARTVRASAF
jgi:hypothetical protein